MAAERIENRLHVDQDLATGHELGLDQRHAHYLRNVLRLGPGARLAVFTAREAAERCGRLSVPEVRAPLDLGALVAGWPPGRRLLVCAEWGAARPIAEALGAAAREESDAPWAVMTGPEGGFAQSELDALRDLPFVTPVGLGPRLLRADTAALAALACWQAVLGDGRSRPPGHAPAES